MLNWLIQKLGVNLAGIVSLHSADHKAAKQLGWITAYSHAFGIQHALEALVLRPVITGVNWYTSFDTPDQNGLVAIAPGATVRGGHEVVADGIDADNQLVWFWNSWGVISKRSPHMRSH